MERKEGRVKTGFSRIFWAIIVIVLCAAPALRADLEVPAGTTMDIDGSVYVGLYLWVYGTANLLPGASVDWIVMATETSVVNIKGGTVGWFIDVAPGAQVTVYGTGFNLGEGTFEINGLVTGTYENGDPINLTFDCQTGATVTLAAPGGDDPAQLIQDLIDTVTGMNLQQGIDNSLDAKLDAALGALDDVNQNNDAAAINTLQAFINAVEAQRDSKITSAQADILVADAQAIIDLLSAQ
jgi:hypothetical protein